MINDHFRNVLLTGFVSWIFLIFAGCAHDDARERAFIGQTLLASSSYEKNGELGNAVEELKVALAVDSGNSDIREKLERLTEQRDREAKKHFKAGMAVSNSDLKGAKKEFLKALRIRIDYPEAVEELRKIRLAVTESAIETRIRKEAKSAAVKPHGKMEAVGDEGTEGEDYSLDAAIAAFDAGDFDAAVREFEKMRVRYPNDPDIRAYLDNSWYYSGIASFNRKDYDRALASFTRVPKGFQRVDEYVAKCRAARK